MNALYQRAYSFVGEVINSAKQGATFSVDVALAILTRIIGMKGATDLLYKQAIYAQEAKQDTGFTSALVIHSVNVGVYALRIGEGMNFEDHRLVDLGLAALLHDIGMTRLPESILTKGKWTNEEKAEMQRHPQYGYEILSKLGKDYQWVADVALPGAGAGRRQRLPPGSEGGPDRRIRSDHRRGRLLRRAYPVQAGSPGNAAFRRGQIHASESAGHVQPAGTQDPPAEAVRLPAEKLRQAQLRRRREGRRDLRIPGKESPQHPDHQSERHPDPSHHRRDLRRRSSGQEINEKKSIGGVGRLGLWEEKVASHTPKLSTLLSPTRREYDN